MLLLVIARRVSKPTEIRAARKRVVGLLLEMWLYGDSPRQLVRTQFALVAANLRYATLVLPTALACAGPMILLWFALDPLLGRAPIPAGGTAIVTARGVPRDSELVAPSGVRVETPALRLDTGEIQWRIRADSESDDAIRFTIRDSEKGITIGYPERTIRFAGVALRWEWWFAFLSSLTALLLHRRFGVSL